MSNGNTLTADEFLKLANAAGLGHADAVELAEFYNTTRSRLTVLEGGLPADIDLGYVDVRDYLTPNDPAAANANRNALQTLEDDIKAGTIPSKRIYWPTGEYYIAPKSGVGEDNLASLRLRGHNDVEWFGDGMNATKIIWEGDMALSSRYLVWIAGASMEALANITTPAPTSNRTFRGIWFGIGDVTNWNAGEQNHLFRVYTEKRGDVKNVRFIDCGFGVVKGDAVFLNGEHNSTAGVMTYVDGVLIQGCVFDGYQHKADTPPTFGYRCCVAHQKGLRNLRYVGNTFTGSDDSLLDFEPTGGIDGTNGINHIAIVGNNFIPASPAGAASAKECISFGGTGEVEGSYLAGLEFVGNTVFGGRVRGLRVTRADVSHNIILTDSTGVLTTPAVYFIDRVESLKIHGNHIWCPSGFSGNYAIEVYNEILPANEEAVATIQGNTISVAGTNGIFVDSMDADIIGNRIINRSNVADSKIGIQVRATSNDMVVNILGNTIRGGVGGGTFQYGISVFPDDNDIQASVTNNVVQSSGVGVRMVAPSVGGTYTPMPVVSLNSFLSCATPVSLGAAVYAIIGGNVGDITLTMGGSTSPEAVVTAIQGSRHVRKNGDSTQVWYKSTGTGNTGWVQETMP